MLPDKVRYHIENTEKEIGTLQTFIQALKEACEHDIHPIDKRREGDPDFYCTGCHDDNNFTYWVTIHFNFNGIYYFRISHTIKVSYTSDNIKHNIKEIIESENFTTFETCKFNLTNYILKYL